MRFTLTITIPEGAFPYPAAEVDRLLQEAVRDMRSGDQSGSLWDLDGRRAGEWSITSVEVDA